MATVPGIGPGGWDSSKLANNQIARHETAPAVAQINPVVFRLYTEYFPNLRELTSRYFGGFTMFTATGVWEGVPENSIVIEIVGRHTDLQTVVHLAGDIRIVNNQTAVLVTWNPTSSLLVTA